MLWYHECKQQAATQSAISPLGKIIANAVKRWVSSSTKCFRPVLSAYQQRWSQLCNFLVPFSHLSGIFRAVDKSVKNSHLFCWVNSQSLCSWTECINRSDSEWRQLAPAALEPQQFEIFYWLKSRIELDLFYNSRRQLLYLSGSVPPMHCKLLWMWGLETCLKSLCTSVKIVQHTSMLKFHCRHRQH